MDKLKYKIIKTRKQYDEYCQILEDLVSGNDRDNENIEEEIELLTLIIEKWDEEHNSFSRTDPVEMLKSLMEENNIKSKDLVKILGVSKGMVSSTLNYRRGLSKDNIRTLSRHFKISQEAFNRPYKLIGEKHLTTV
jgi:HTH-type transcriptional regulator/antitoxin HigA